MLLLTAITLLAMSPVVSYAQYTMLVHKTDGDVLRLSLADVDSVSFEYAESQDTVPGTVAQPNNEIWYTSTDGNIVIPTNAEIFGANLISNTYENGRGKMVFDGDVTMLGDEHVSSSTQATFNYKNTLDSIFLPSSVRKIGSFAFCSCSNLRYIKMPDSLDYLGNSAIWSSAIEKLYIPKTKRLLYPPCEFNNKLTQYEGPYASSDGRYLIENGELFGFAPGGLTTYTIPGDVRTISGYAFYGCLYMKTVNIGEGVTTIFSSAFGNCNALESFYVPAGVERIGTSVMYGDSKVTSIAVAPGNTVYDSRGDCNAIIETATNTLIAGCRNTVIPSDVTAIAEKAFAFCLFDSVTIPASVSAIGFDAFYACSRLSGIRIMATTPPTIRGDVFRSTNNCPIYVPAESLDAYMGAENWSAYADRIRAAYEPQQPNNEIWYTSTDGAVVDPYDASVFGATLLSNTYQDGKGVMTFSAPVLQIGRYAFKGRNKLETIKIPSSVTSFMWCCFEDCSSLSSVNIPDNVTEVDVASFMDCSSLTSIVLPDKVRGLDNQIFSNCGKLSSIQFSDSITYIAHWVFESTPITSIVIPATVSSIAWGSIADCDNLTSVTVDARNTYYDSRGNCNAIIHTATNTLISGCATTVIPQDVTALYDYSFFCCDRLKTITIPEGVETIGRQAFQSCDSLKTLIVPSTVTDIGLGAFGYCPQMTSIVFLSTTPPTAGDGILDYSNNCPIYVPEGSVAAYKEAENWSVYANRIMAIPGETANHQPGNEIWYTSTDGAVVAPNDASVFGATLLSNTYQNGKGVMTFDGFVTQVGWDAFNGCSKLVTVDLPSGVAEIGWCAFRGCSNLSSISIPDGVSSIFVGAFMECTSLTSITFPDAVRSLNNQVFYGCTNLSSIHFSDSITYIAHWVFEYTPISSIVIPATVSQIDWGSIAGCRNLTSVSVDPRNTYYDSRGNCNAIIRTATNTLISGCATTVIPQDVTALYDYAFTSCTGLDTITIPEGVTTIGRQVFQGCSNLSSITIPSTVQTMGQSVFNACQNLSYVKVLATVPPTIGETVFSTYNNCPIYVPAESLQAYKEAPNWSTYESRIRPIP